MIWIILIIIAIPIISGGNQVIKEYVAMYDEDERKRKEKMNKERMAREKLRAKQREEYNECIRQLEAVQYQISLLEKLDEFRPGNLEKEENIKKALAMEKQYNALWTKERKLKQKIKNLRTP